MKSNRVLLYFLLGFLFLFLSTQVFAASSPTVTTQTATNILDTTATGNGTVTNDGGSSLTFDGSQNYASVTTLGNLGSSLGSGFYLSFSIKTTSTSTLGIMGMDSYGTNTVLLVEAYPSSNYTRLFIRDHDGKTLDVHWAGTYNDGNAHTIVIQATPTSNTATMTLDGTLVTNRTYSQQGSPANFQNFAYPLYVGAENNYAITNTSGSVENPSNATLDDVSIGTSSNNIYGSYFLDEGSGTTAADRSGNGNNATLGGSPVPTWSTDLGTIVTQTGIVWNTSANPTLSTNLGSQTGSTTSGSFTASMTGLSPSTTYHYRAYATNTTGTGYGADTTVTTTGPRYAISGTVFTDSNQDGTQDNGESGYKNAIVTLSGNANATVTTGSTGSYSFSNLPIGTYTVTATTLKGYTPTTTNPVTKTISTNTTVNFGMVPAAPSFFGAIDTMKDSQDTVNNQMTTAQIAQNVTLTAQQNVNYITVDTFYDYPTYMKEWIDAVRATGKHVWFRTHFNCWELTNGCTIQMSPTDYLASLTTFINAHPTYFQPGDILDANPEPENSNYWSTTYGVNWTYQNAPNSGTDAYNQFLIDVSTTSATLLQQNGVNGVITGVRSTSSYFPQHPISLYSSTISELGYITYDSYPEGSTTDATTATNDRITELNTIIADNPGIPIVLGEMGYSNNVNVDDTTQVNVLTSEFNAISAVSSVTGLNYWVGAGGSGYGGYTNLFTGSRGSWQTRPSASIVASYFLAKIPLPTLTSKTNDTTISTANASGGGEDINMHTGWRYKVDAGPSFIGLPSFIPGIDAAEDILAFISGIATHDDVHVVITKKQPSDLLHDAIPFPWMQGMNTASDIYNFSVYAAFNGYPIQSFDNPITIVLHYDPQRLYGVSPSALRIAWFNKATTIWSTISANTVLDTVHHTIANTTTTPAYFTVVYPNITPARGQHTNILKASPQQTNKQSKNTIEPIDTITPMVTRTAQKKPNQQSNIPTKRCLFFICF